VIVNWKIVQTNRFYRSARPAPALRDPSDDGILQFEILPYGRTGPTFGGRASPRAGASKGLACHRLRIHFGAVDSTAIIRDESQRTRRNIPVSRSAKIYFECRRMIVPSRFQRREVTPQQDERWMVYSMGLPTPEGIAGSQIMCRKFDLAWIGRVDIRLYQQRRRSRSRR